MTSLHLEARRCFAEAFEKLYHESPIAKMLVEEYEKEQRQQLALRQHNSRPSVPRGRLINRPPLHLEKHEHPNTHHQFGRTAHNSYDSVERGVERNGGDGHFQRPEMQYENRGPAYRNAPDYRRVYGNVENVPPVNSMAFPSREHIPPSPILKSRINGIVSSLDTNSEVDASEHHHQGEMVFDGRHYNQGRYVNGNQASAGSPEQLQLNNHMEMVQDRDGYRRVENGEESNSEGEVDYTDGYVPYHETGEYVESNHNQLSDISDSDGEEEDNMEQQEGQYVQEEDNMEQQEGQYVQEEDNMEQQEGQYVQDDGEEFEVQIHHVDQESSIPTLHKIDDEQPAKSTQSYSTQGKEMQEINRNIPIDSQQVPPQLDPELTRIRVDDKDGHDIKKGISKTIQSNQVPKAVKEYSLDKWIIKPLDLCKGLAVEGHRSEDPAETYWQSSKIVGRVDSKTVETASGTLYRLVGNLKVSDAFHAGFPKYVVRRFANGFPINWETIIKNFYRKKNNSTKQNKTFAAPSRKQPAKENKNRKSEPFKTQFGTPTLPEMNDLPKTRSGRMVKPQLAWWAGQRVRVHNKTGTVEITPVESPSLDMSFDNIVERQANHSVSYNPSRKIRQTSFRDTPKVTRKAANKAKKSPVVNLLANLKTDERETDIKVKGKVKQCTVVCESLDLNTEVLGVIKNHKQKRAAQNKKGPKNTCYSPRVRTDEAEMNTKTSGVGKDNNKQYSMKNKSREACKTDIHVGYYLHTTGKENAKTGESKSPQVPILSEAEDSNDEADPKGIEGSSEDSDTTVNTRTRSKVRKRISSREGVKSANQERKSVGDSSSDTDCEQLPRTKRRKSTRAQTLNKVKTKDDKEQVTDMGPPKRITRSATGNRSAKVIYCYQSETEKNSSDDIEVKKKKGKNSKATKESQKKLSGPKKGKEAVTSEESTREPKAKRIASRSAATKADSYVEAPKLKPWSNKETDTLYKAVNKYSPDDVQFWELVAGALPKRSVEECQEFYYRTAPKDTKETKQKAKQFTKTSKPTTLSGKVGTLKRKRELRDIMDQRQDGYEDDFFDATPMRKQTHKVPILDEEDDDIFGDKLPFDTPAATRTPFLRHIAPVSTRKTPHIGGYSPGNQDVDRNEVDRYVHRMMKRRKIAPEVKNDESKKTTMEPVDYQDDIFTARDQPDDEDSEVEKDYYWSDE